ncbi:TonB-dependent receptor [Shewanella violacea]|nr:TonB-dependent receptor [Shewanella violacea]
MSKKSFSFVAKLSLISTALLSVINGANAAEATQVAEIERIQITGSSIKRTDMEGALPVTTFSEEDIAKTGVTSVPELMQQIPAMQGFTVGAQSVGAGNGSQTASLRDLGSDYTLVLLNGRRMASRNSGGSVDISSIPLAAIKRVEVLMDGASALYGSDAIAGVINFITKSDFTGLKLTGRLDRPEAKGGESANFDIAAGIGDLSNDGWNVMMTYSHAQQELLKSSDREFSNTGIVPFTYDGTDLYVQRASSNAIPANLYLKFNEEVNGSTSKSYNPYREANGDLCAPNNAPTGSTCLYDFTEMVEIFPESASDNFFVSGVLDINENIQAYTDIMYSEVEMTTRIAAKTVSNYSFDLDSGFVTELLQPMLSQEEYNALSSVKVKWRARPAGSRTSKYETATTNMTAGIRGDIGDLAYNLAVTNAKSTREHSRIAGYVLAEEFGNLIESGAIDVFTTPDKLSPEVNKAVAATNYNGLWQTTETSSNSLEGTLSAPVYELPAGELYLGTGFDYRQVSYSNAISEANKQELLYSYSATEEFDLSRDTYGLFIEAIAPITDTLELTAAIRYDNIGGITDGKRAAEEQGVTGDMSDVTYKVNMSWRPTDDWVVRASHGTGFKAPSMKELASPKVESGWTSGSYECPITSASHDLYSLCSIEPTQYREAVQGYSELKPETSEQTSVGFVYSPSSDFSVSIDWWQINIENQVRELQETQVMANPQAYDHMFSSRTNTQSGEGEIEITYTPVNIGESRNQGIDWLVSAGHDLGFGMLKSTLRGAYILESEYLRVGSEGIWDTSLGKFGLNNAVTFPHIIKFTNSFTHGDFVHNLNMNYKSGYQDQSYSANNTKIRLQEDLNVRYDQEVERNVSSYTTFDWLSQWNAMESLQVSFGIKNMFDRAPPFSLRTSGGGHQVGYDPRYVDQLGRTYYLKASYSL